MKHLKKQVVLFQVAALLCCTFSLQAMQGQKSSASSKKQSSKESQSKAPEPIKGHKSQRFYGKDEQKKLAESTR